MEAPLHKELSHGGTAWPRTPPGVFFPFSQILGVTQEIPRLCPGFEAQSGTFDFLEWEVHVEQANQTEEEHPNERLLEVGQRDDAVQFRSFENE